MGHLIIPNVAPASKEKTLRRIADEFLDVSRSGETNEEWVRAGIKVGAATTAGAEIMAAIAAGEEDIYVYLVGGYFETSRFDPDIPMIVLNLAKRGFVPAQDPQAMRSTIMLFHELGHAAQWITRRDWFTASTAQSDANRQPYYVEIEKDNLERYERPMCIQLGEPYRWHYDDMFNDAGEAQQRWNKMNTAATTIQAQLRGYQARQRFQAMKAATNLQ
jgi:hypothetical protein